VVRSNTEREVGSLDDLTFVELEQLDYAHRAARTSGWTQQIALTCRGDPEFV
jgi:hypothetical protein